MESICPTGPATCTHKVNPAIENGSEEFAPGWTRGSHQHVAPEYSVNDNGQQRPIDNINICVGQLHQITDHRFDPIFLPTNCPHISYL